jgi:hypothetical protein
MDELKMARPCTCNNVIPDSVYDISQCQMCWHYHHNDRIRRAWDDDEPIVVPPMLEQTGSLISSIVKWGFAGCTRVPMTVVESRLSVCDACEFKKEDKCGVCGCFLNTKSSWTTEKCPLGKWSEHDTSGSTPN